MSPILASRAQRIAAVAVLVSLGAVGFLPLFGGPGYEHALASGLIVPSAAAIATSLEVSSAGPIAPLTCVWRGVTSGCALAGIAFLTALLHGLRVGICDFWGGTTFFVLTAGIGGVMGGLWGALVGETCRGARLRRTLSVALALSGPLAGIAVTVARFYGSPMVFGFDPFFGYFSGALYDTVVDVRTELWTYRAGSLATATGFALVMSGMGRSPRGGLALGAARSHRLALAAGVAAILAGFAVFAEGPALGHWQTASTIAATLGGQASGPRCDVFYPDTLLAAQTQLLVRDCEEELASDEERLGAHLDGRLAEFVFADSSQKRRLMGAADTSIAKPWRREVYVQLAPYPHPVLGHEIAHVVAGSFAPGPFHVGGGLWPNPGLIEGTAVATSPDDDELTGAQWARAMLDLGILPRIKQIFSLGFLGQSAERSYTVAGAFVSWVRDRWGSSVVRSWYGGGSIEGLTREPWGALEGEFAGWLRTLPMPEGASAYARAKFERPSVWARRCPHVVDALDRAADKCREDHRLAQAASLYSQALSRDPDDWHAQLDGAKVLVAQGDETGRVRLEALATGAPVPRTWQDRAAEALADDDLARGADDQAAEGYRAIAGRTLDEDVARTLEVKALAAGDPPARRALLDFLVETPGHALDPWVGAASLAGWATATQAPLAEYLVGKNFALHAVNAPSEGWDRAAAWLDRALASGAPTPRIGRELLRERAICACILRDDVAVAHVLSAVQASDSPFANASGGRREWLLAFMRRCRSPGS